MQYKLFISYGRADGGAAATEVRQLLGRALGDTWRDQDNLVGGREFSKDIEQALTAADAVVLIVTPGAAGSDWVERELQFARGLHKRVIPLLYIDGDYPPAWRDLQMIDFRPARPEARQALAELVQAIRAIWEEVKQAVTDARNNDADGVFTRVFDRLVETMTTTVRPPYGPEVPLLCLHIVERLAAIGNLGDAADELEQGSIVAPDSTWATAYATHKPTVAMLFRNFLNGVPRPPVKVVRLVLAVMTANEAAELAGGDAFGPEDVVLREHFVETVQPLLQRVPDWQTHYGERPESWRPYGGRTLGALVQGWFNDYTQEHGTGDRIRAQFIDIRTLNDESRRVLRELRNDGCELVVDAVSLCHPRIFAEYRRAALDVLPNTRVARVSSLQMPVFDRALRIPIQQHIDSYFYERQGDGDTSCDTAGTEPELRRWTNVIAEAVSPRPTGNHARSTGNDVIYTFYSYKGGVGRSMALANIAEVLCRRGLDVVVVDFDLEAPGLERYFDGPATLDAMLAQRGVVDLLQSFREVQAMSLAGPAAAKENTNIETELGRLIIEPIERFLIDIYASGGDTGRLRFMPAGRRDGAEFREYAKRVLSLNWDEFFDKSRGELFFELLHAWLRDRDLLLIRQRVAADLTTWERDQDASNLLSGSALAAAARALREHGDEFTATERDFIEMSEGAGDRGRPLEQTDEVKGRLTRLEQLEARVRWSAVAAVVLILAVAFYWFRYGSKTPDGSIPLESMTRAAAAASQDPLEQALLLATLSDSATPTPATVELAQTVARDALPIAVLPGHVSTVSQIQFTADGGRVLTQSAEAVMVQRSDASRSAIVLRPGNGRRFLSAAMTPDGRDANVLITSSEGLRTLQLWDIGNDEPRLVREEAGGPVSGPLTFLMKQPVAIWDDPDGYSVRAWIGKSETKRLFSLPVPERSRSIMFSQDGAVMAVFESVANAASRTPSGEGVDWRVRIIAPEGGRERRRFTLTAKPILEESLAFTISVDGRYVATSAGQVLDTATGAEYQASPSSSATPEPVRTNTVSVGIASDGQTLARGTYSGVVSVSRISRPGGGSAFTSTLRGHRAQVSALEFNTTAGLLATSSADGDVRIWRTTPTKLAAGTSWPELIKSFRSATTACLSADQQTRLLQRTPAAAQAAFLDCEKQHGRNPTTPQQSEAR